MSHDAVIALLVVGCLASFVAVAGTLWMADGFDQLHYAGSASTVGVLAFIAAVILQGFASASGVVDCVIALAMTLLLGPVLVTATGRTGRRIRYENLEPRPEEFERQPEGD